MDMGFTEYLREYKWQWEPCASKLELEENKADLRDGMFFTECTSSLLKAFELIGTCSTCGVACGLLLFLLFMKKHYLAQFIFSPKTFAF